MEDTTVQTESGGHTTSNVSSLESFTCNKRLLEDIGGEDNLTMFISLLSKYVENSAHIVVESSKFTDATSTTEFDFSYAYHNSYLFAKFLELSPVYMGAAWFVQKYTLRRRVQRIVTLGEILYVKNIHLIQEFISNPPNYMLQGEHET